MTMLIVILVVVAAFLLGMSLGIGLLGANIHIAFGEERYSEFRKELHEKTIAYKIDSDEEYKRYKRVLLQEIRENII